MARRRRPPRPGALSELRPLKIAGQILALQTIYYLVAVVLILFTTLVSGTPFSLDLVFSWRDVRSDATTGWVWAIIWVFDGGLAVALAIIALISRSKLVPDFSLSLHTIHLVVVTVYSGNTIPRNAFWWFVMASSSALSIGLGVWGCRYRELKPVFFGGGGNSRSNESEQEEGLIRGRGRNRENGQYELADMGKEDGDR